MAKAKQAKRQQQQVTTADEPQQAAHQCPVCQGTEHSVTGELPETDYAGVRDDGTRFTTIRRQQVACLLCGQRSIVKLYTYDPAKWQ